MLNENSTNEYDVIVVGGGSTGIVAAVAAARHGAKTLLVDRMGYLGGESATGLWWFTFHNMRGERIVDGIPWELVGRLKEIGGSTGPVRGTMTHFYSTTPVDPEIWKALAIEVVHHSGVDILLHTWMDRVETQDGTVVGVWVRNKSGERFIGARSVIDATGDADVAAMAGAATEKGREGDGKTQAMTLRFTLGGVDVEKAGSVLSSEGFVRATPPGQEAERFMVLQGTFGAWEDQVQAEGLFPDRAHQLWALSYRPGELVINTTRVLGRDATNGEDLSAAEVEARLHVPRIVDFLKREVSGFSSAYLTSVPAKIGVRESRRLVGQTTLTDDDVLSGRRFPDAIARASYPIDIHDPSGKGTTFEQVERGGDYDIPFGSIVPRDMKGILVAGRCLSATHRALASARVIVSCMAMGQAAGTAAALASASDIDVTETSPDVLREALLADGVDLVQLVKA
jgi:ribulose 1,5-bisphosphate synthetase/thiazole synthase